MQLMGFNSRRAIGEPLTELPSRLILAQSPDPGRAAELQVLNARTKIALFEVATDPQALERLKAIIGGVEAKVPRKGGGASLRAGKSVTGIAAANRPTVPLPESFAARP